MSLAVGDVVVHVERPDRHGVVRTLGEGVARVQWSSTAGNDLEDKVETTSLVRIDDWPERIALVSNPVSIETWLDEGRKRRAWNNGGHEKPTEGMDGMSMVDARGVEHVSFTVPWPGRTGYIIGFRGIICKTCRCPAIEPNPPWIPPVIRCVCKRKTS